MAKGRFTFPLKANVILEAEGTDKDDAQKTAAEWLSDPGNILKSLKGEGADIEIVGLSDPSNIDWGE